MARRAAQGRSHVRPTYCVIAYALLVFTWTACSGHARANPTLIMCISARQFLEAFDRVSAPAVVRETNYFERRYRRIGEAEAGITVRSVAGATDRQCAREVGHGMAVHLAIHGPPAP